MHHRESVILSEWVRRALFAICICASFGSQTDARSTAYVVKNSHHIPEGWSLVRRAPAEQAVELHIGLKQAKFGDLERRLSEVSDPSHARYGQYLTAKEVNDLVTPSDLTLSLVEGWLSSHGITTQQITYSPASDWLMLNLSLGVAEDLLQSDYNEYQHESTGVKIVRAPQWLLPHHLHDHIESIQPTNSFMYTSDSRIDFPRSVSSPQTRGDDTNNQDLNQLAEHLSEESPQLLNLDDLPDDLTVEQACNASAVTPLCVRTLYGMHNYKAQAADKNSMGLLNYNGEFNNRFDLQSFLEKYRPDAARAGVAYTFQADDIAGGINQQTALTPEQLKVKAGREGALDAQILLGVAFPTPMTAYTVGGQAPVFKSDVDTPTNTNEPFLTWLHHMLSLEELPKVIAISYGEHEQTVPYAYAKRVCESFAQLGARGTTVIFGAGDYGVGKEGLCRSNDGSNAYEFMTYFPAGCPYVTSVGATRNILPTEVVAYNENNGFVSGGGFSKYFPRPSWQRASGVVDAYLSQPYHEQHQERGSNTTSILMKYAPFFNHEGRAYPDVASQGYRRVIVWNNQTLLVDGTSASAPTFGAVIALVNDALIAQGKPVLGFLNPWLYQVGHAAFTDVTKGSTTGCGTSGWPARAGWDSASGFGTPWFPKLVELASNRPFRNQRPWYWSA